MELLLGGVARRKFDGGSRADEAGDGGAEGERLDGAGLGGEGAARYSGADGAKHG